MQPAPNVPTPGFKELIRTIWSLIKPNRVLNFLLGGGGTSGRGTCLTPNLFVLSKQKRNILRRDVGVT